MAEAVMKNICSTKNLTGWEVDSCGTSDYNIGKQPYHLTLRTLKEHGIKDFRHKARQIRSSDFTEFDHILVMDHNNLSDVKYEAPKDCPANIEMLTAYDPQKAPYIVDPYYEEDSVFEDVYQLISRCCVKFVETYSKNK
ncbi:DgyrCDS9521 [Dimorphilus gyrociliatus]|nr:DgyrCDS9521 [Dimorphilus gyrociliatus]